MNNLRFSYSYSPYDNLMGYGKSSGRNETDGKYVWGSGFGNGIGQCSEEQCVDNDDIVGLMEVIMIYAKTREMIRELFLRT
jgi:hypothetical protein